MRNPAREPSEGAAGPRILLHQAKFERNVLATLLPAIAGAVNASGFFALGTYTSHMTGVVSRTGDELAQRHWWLASRSFAFLGCFMFGAMTATALVLYARRAQQPAFWRPLLVEAGILFCFASATVGTATGSRVHFDSFTMTSLICVAMGLQNALVTKLSGARIRTTHLTGVTTDIGIELMKVLNRWRVRSSGRSLWRRLSLIGELGGDVEARHLRLHLRIFGCFLAGATGGPALYLVIGHWAMLIPVMLLFGLAILDIQLGLGSRP
jgi:uncharacterized membrane protein YoaK (UPF0700 family)